MRAPFFHLMRRSPLDDLIRHSEITQEGIELLAGVLELYFAGKHDEIDPIAELLYQKEHEADLIKGNIRNHLHKYILLPVDRWDLLNCLKEQDAIIDVAQDICVWLNLSHYPIPMELIDKFMELFRMVKTTVDEEVQTLKLAVEYIRHPFTKRRLRKKAKLMLKEIHHYEHEADIIARRIGRMIFEQQRDPVGIIVLLRLSEFIGHIADHAANAGDRIRMMIGR
ncbi:TIGR00153 family protein [candidate division bacterium WOR-3 4484_18]|uniref:TIGR00153 family protein n=1 Tax=candidate division WOR-3 bacterium 4484_18 TaxID=2020626 RepID=A0A257LWJ3_UNCW3|nr:MAG: TIGR00153 family protein [candidate division bacterium WOR-3 4484_18]